MPYDTLCWGEEGAANGLTGTVACTGQNHAASGDTLTLQAGTPYLLGLGNTGDTKPNGCSLVPSRSNRGKAIYGPGAIPWAQLGWVDLRPHVKRLYPGETLTGNRDSTNTNEGGIVGANISYDGFPAHTAWQNRRYSDTFEELVTVTSAAAVTFNSGSTKLDSACTDASWIDSKKNYEIIGISMVSGNAATFGGVMNVTNLPGVWKGRQPGIPVNGLSAVTFSSQQVFTPCAEPIPFQGSAPPTVGMTASSAGAAKVTMHIGEL